MAIVFCGRKILLEECHEGIHVTVVPFVAEVIPFLVILRIIRFEIADHYLVRQVLVEGMNLSTALCETILHLCACCERVGSLGSSTGFVFLLVVDGGIATWLVLPVVNINSCLFKDGIISLVLGFYLGIFCLILCLALNKIDTMLDGLLRFLLDFLSSTAYTLSESSLSVYPLAIKWLPQ